MCIPATARSDKLTNGLQEGKVETRGVLKLAKFEFSIHLGLGGYRIVPTRDL